MYWEESDGSSDKFSSFKLPWISEAQASVPTSLTGTIAKMAKLRKQTTSIYVKALLKDNKPKANCNIR